MPLTPGLEQLDASQIMDAFMGLPVQSPSKEPKKEAKTNDNPKEGEGKGKESESEEEAKDDESEASEQEEGEESESEEEAKDDESEASEQEEGEESESKEEGKEDPLKEHPGLRKRFNALLRENPQLKRQVKTLTEQLEARNQQPEIVSAADASNPLAEARTDAEVDRLAGDMLADAKAKLRWLNKHFDGGVWQEGTANERQMSPQQVEEAIEYYEDLTGKLDTAKTDRKAWLKTYGETAKVLGAEKVTALVKPTVATRESELFAKVPELMRDPSFLMLLADAQAGRENREKAAKGIKFVEVKAAQQVNKPKGDTPKPGEGGSKPGGDGKPAPKQEQGKGAPLTQAALDKLRTDAAGGDKRAQAEIDKYFLGL